MSDLSKKVLEKIKKESIKPRPKWQLRAMRIALWSAVGFAMLLAIVSMGVIFHEVSEVEWSYAHRLGKGPIPGAVVVLPYVWMILLGVTLLLASLFFSKTEKGYKFNSMIVGGIVVVFLIFGGWLFHVTSGARDFDKALEDFIPLYHNMQMHRQQLWVDPENGIIMGVVSEIPGEKVLKVLDMRGQLWTVKVEGVDFKVAGTPVVGKRYVIIGAQKDGNEFEAEEMIMPAARQMMHPAIKK